MAHYAPESVAQYRRNRQTFLVSFPLTVIFVHSLIYRFTTKVEEIRLKNSKILLAGNTSHAMKLESLFGKMEDAKLKIKGIIDCGIGAKDEQYETTLATLLFEIQLFNKIKSNPNWMIV